MKKAAIFCHNGLGDAANSLLLATNLHLNGYQVTMVHQLMPVLQAWAPHVQAIRYPPVEAIPRILEEMDLIVVFHIDTGVFANELIRQGKAAGKNVKLLYMIPSTRIKEQPYYSDAEVDPKQSLADNILKFCREKLRLPEIQREPGWKAPSHLLHRKHSRRVILHCASTRAGKNWPIEKFNRVAGELRKEGWEPILFTGKESCPLVDLAEYIYESGYAIGNDSGICHLASAFGLPTLVLARRRTFSRFWRPGFAATIVLNPPSWIPNLKGLRLRDRYWKFFISPAKVLKAFRVLSGSAKVP